MKRALLLLALAAPLCAQVDPAREMRCIVAVETGGRWIIGRHGEHGPSQMTRAARMRSRDPMGYLLWLIRIVPDPTPYRIALAWHAGPDGMATATANQRDHAVRVRNLYNAGY